jgi:hypothetical protein
MRFLVLVFMFLAFLTSACRRDERPAVKTINPYRLLLVLDPTVADLAWSHQLIDVLMDRLGEDSRVMTWTISTGAVGHSSGEEFLIPFNPNVKIADLSEVERVSERLHTRFTQHWDAVHQGASGVKVPRSCILTSLYQVSRYLKDNGDLGRVDTDLVIASDLLEACADWGTLVNLERDLLQSKTVLTQEAKAAISLTGVRGTWAVRANSQVADTPSEVERLTELWTRALSELGASTPNVIDDPNAIKLTRERPGQPSHGPRFEFAVTPARSASGSLR